MSTKGKAPSSGKSRARPWGSAIGLLTGCFVALAGVALGFEPETVALRAVVGSFVVGIVVSIACSLVRQWSA